MNKALVAMVLLSVTAYASTDTVKSADVPSHPSHTPTKKKYVEVLKMKGPDTTHGQVLSPGQKPPSTTFAEAEKAATSVSISTP